MSGPTTAREWSESEFATALEKVTSNGTVEADGRLITREQLAQLIAAAAAQADARLNGANFRGSTFADGASFADLTFDGDADFVGASFLGEVSFAATTFNGEVRFGATADPPGDPATFLGDAVFSGAMIRELAGFDGVTFERDAAFYGATFMRDTSFVGVTVGADAQFGGTEFASRADFAEAAFSRDAGFAHASFADEAVFAGVTFAGDASFEQAQFDGHAGFERASFRGEAVFEAATFAEDADFPAVAWQSAGFERSTFAGEATFADGTFDRDARFDGVTFAEPVSFDDASFARGVSFVGASFLDDAEFTGASFAGIAGFRETTFMGPARLTRATFDRAGDFTRAAFIADADLAEARFGGPAHFAGATFREAANFDASTFERVRQLGPVLVSETLSFRMAVFVEPVRIEASARRAFFTGAVFRAGADVLLRWAEVVIDDADFAAPSLLAELPAVPAQGGRSAFIGREKPLDESWLRPPLEPGWVCPLDESPQQAAPRLLSLRRAKVAQLTISGADLRACRFSGAYGVDELRLERVRFAQPPSGWQTAGRSRLIRWTRRRTAAEEQHWRREQGHGAAWYTVEDGVRAPRWLDGASTAPTGEELAALYRALRKALEDRKDEPGAGDFYYGEMEMRRRGERESATRRPERAILSLYWLTSGYALRPSRALGALLAVVAVFTTVLYLYGFEDRSHPYATAVELRATPATAAEKPFPPRPGDLLEGWTSFDAWTYSAGTATAVIGAPDAQLTEAGKGLRIALRILGPVLIGLALLSIRGRVKR